MDRKLSCGYCGKEFAATQNQWENRNRGPSYCGPVCLRTARSMNTSAQMKKKLGSAYQAPHPLECAICAVEFTPTRSQWGKHKVRQGNSYCGAECLYVSRSMHSIAMHHAGLVPHGTPAQVAAGKRLAAWSAANPQLGSDHPQWKGGGTSLAIIEAGILRRRINKLLMEKGHDPWLVRLRCLPPEKRRGKTDRKLSCGHCGKEFTPTRQQWKSSKKQFGQYCGAVCLGAVRSQRAAAMWANGELKPRKGIPRLRQKITELVTTKGYNQ